MGLFSGARPRFARDAVSYFGISGPRDLIPPRPFIRPNWPIVTNDSALRHSAVWACLRIRADLISTLPVDVYRRVLGFQVECPKPPVITNPGGTEMDWMEWMYSTQFDLDRAGNTIGLIVERDGFGIPSRIELQQLNTVHVRVKDNRLAKYKIGSTEYEPKDVWHERQFTVPGLHVGLSPVAYAAWEIGQYLTVQQFATDWFAAGAVPKARLKNVAKVLNSDEVSTVKEAWRAALAADEPFVHGADWEYDMLQAAEASADWLESKKFSVTDVCRFFGCPAELVDSAPTGESRGFTYANISQRHLAFLIIHLGPAILRREAKLSAKLLPQPRYLKINADALLRLDPISRANVIKTQIDSRTLAPNEGRELENREPLTAEQIAEFDHFWPPPGSEPAADAGDPGAGGTDVPAGDLIPSMEELYNQGPSPFPGARKMLAAASR